MPSLKIKHVASFSSEDKFNPAENILKPETYYKWRCSDGNEKQATIVLQLEKASQISGVDIGNNGSAFVEVLVGSSLWSPDEEFQVLLASSSFMTPAQSKSGKDLNRVRMFGTEALNKHVACQKWDLVKVACTQPYNQSEPYGLAFVKFYSSELSEDPKESVVKLGYFSLKDSSDDENKTLSCGSFFKKRMNMPVVQSVSPKISMAALARSNSPPPRSDKIFKTSEEPSVGSKKISISEQKRNEVARALLQGAEDNAYSKENVISKIKVPKSIETQKESSKEMKDRPNQKALDTKDRNDVITNVLDSPPTKKVKLNSNRPKFKRKHVPLNKIMAGVVFVLSGYQNPERGNIRDKAISMGAKYEASWSSRCTHLICAFANTPKFKEVMGKGKILRKRWIDDCHKHKRKLNTKSYRLDGGGESTFESSGSEDENTSGSAKLVSKTNNGEESPAMNDETDSLECDTEDEIDKIRMLEKENSANIPDDEVKAASDDEYGATTDTSELNEVENSDVNLKIDSASAPNFFEGKSFLLYGNFDKKDSRLLKRYITTYSGCLKECMKDGVNYVISDEKWDDTFREALNDNSSLLFIQPKWIFKCHEKQELIPHESYEIKPM